MTNSRSKGARGERLARDWLRSIGYDCHRSQQFCGRAGDSDVTLAAGDAFIEVKVGYPNLDVASVAVVEWIKKAQRDSGGKPWLILWKPDRRVWRVIAPRMGVVGMFVGDNAVEVVKQTIKEV